MHRLRMIALTFLGIGALPPLAAQVRPPVAGQPYQYWEILEPDGGARKIYFRNDLTTPMTITEVVIQRCENTRQLCGTYPAKLVVEPGKTVMAFKVERLDKKLGWSFSYSFHTTGSGQLKTLPPSDGPGVLPPGSIVMKTVAVDSLAPLVAAITENPSCGSVTTPNLPEGHQALVMVFGPVTQPTARTVLVKVDASKAPYDYQDVRREPVDNVASPYLSVITIDFVRQTVTLQNSGHGEQTKFFNAAGGAIRNATSLGNPMETVAKIVKECGK